MKLSWILVIILPLLLTMSVAAVQESAEDPAVARSLAILQSIVKAGNYSDTRNLIEQWIDILEQEFGPEHPVILGALHTEGRIRFERGAYADAASIFEQQVELSKRIHGPEDPRTLEPMGWVAAMLHYAGNHSKARMLGESILETQRRIIGENHPDTLTTRNNLAETLRSQGDLVGARQHHEQVLEERRRILGAEHADTLTTMNNLALTLKAQGDLAGTRLRYEEVLAIQSRVLGSEHPDTLTASAGLALTLKAQGDLVGARLLQEKVLEAVRRDLGAEHPDSLTALGNLALTLKAQGDLVAARERNELVLAARHRILGPGHPDALTAMNNLALTLEAQGDLAGARWRQEEVLEGRRRVLGSRHPDTLAAMSNLALTLKAQGDLVGARLYQEEILQKRHRVLGARHPDTLAAMSNVASTLRAQGDLDGAREREEQVVAARYAILGAEHPDTLRAMNNLAVTLEAQGDLVATRSLEEKVLKAQHRLLGTEHPETLTTMNNLAATLFKQGDVAGAAYLHEQVFRISRNVLGVHHPNTLGAMHNLAWIRKESGDAEEARELYEQVVRLRATAGGDRRPVTDSEVETFFGLGEIYREAGRLDQASQALHAALDALESQADRFDLSEDVKSRFRSDKSVAHHAAIDVALQRKRIDEGFHILERYRAQSLLTLLQWGQPQGTDPASGGSARDEIAERSDEILHKLDQLDPETDRAQWLALLTERSQLQRQREALWYQRMQDRRGGQELTAHRVDKTRRQLDPGTVLLAFNVTNGDTNLFVLSHKGPLEVHQLPVTEPELWLQVAKFRALIFPKLGAPEADSPQEASEESTDTSGFDARVKLGRWLYDQLLAKVDRRIADSQRLLILPDGPLYYLPFAAVMAPASDKPSGWQYLTEWKPVHTAQSATVYAELQQWRKKQEGTTPTLVALGDPSYPQSGPQPASQDSDKEAATHHLPFAVRSMVDRGLFDGLLPLPNTAREIDGIAGLFPKDHVRKYLGNQATEDRAKQELETASYVHLAAHGLADPFNSLNSFLALTIPEKWSADKNNGILQAWEVIDHLRLDADLVVLSACATALGPELGGEGLHALRRSRSGPTLERRSASGSDHRRGPGGARCGRDAGWQGTHPEGRRRRGVPLRRPDCGAQGRRPQALGRRLARRIRRGRPGARVGRHRLFAGPGRTADRGARLAPPPVADPGVRRRVDRRGDPQEPARPVELVAVDPFQPPAPGRGRSAATLRRARPPAPAYPRPGPPTVRTPVADRPGLPAIRRTASRIPRRRSSP
jgi:tetratricopeptide (TPR) repeat protein